MPGTMAVHRTAPETTICLHNIVLKIFLHDATVRTGILLMPFYPEGRRLLIRRATDSPGSLLLQPLSLPPSLPLLPSGFYRTPPSCVGFSSAFARRFSRFHCCPCEVLFSAKFFTAFGPRQGPFGSTSCHPAPPKQRNDYHFGGEYKKRLVSILISERTPYFGPDWYV